MTPHDETRPIDQEGLEILAGPIKDPLLRAHVARVTRAAGPRPWFELCMIANRAELSEGFWGALTIRKLGELTYEQLLARAAAEERAMARFDAHLERRLEHRRRMPPGHEDESGDHDVWSFFNYAEGLSETNDWTLRILRRLERARRRAVVS